MFLPRNIYECSINCPMPTHSRVIYIKNWPKFISYWSYKGRPWDLVKLLLKCQKFAYWQNLYLYNNSVLYLSVCKKSVVQQAHKIACNLKMDSPVDFPRVTTSIIYILNYIFFCVSKAIGAKDAWNSDAEICKGGKKSVTVGLFTDLTTR